MNNFSTVRLASMYPLLCLNFHVLNQENRQIFLYKCLTKLSKGHSYIYIYIFFFFFLHFFPFILAVPHGMWNLSPLTKDRTHTPCIVRAVSTFGLPVKCKTQLYIFNSTLSVLKITYQQLDRLVTPGGMLLPLIHISFATVYCFLVKFNCQ